MGILRKIGQALIGTEKAIGSGYRQVSTNIPTGYDFASGTQFLNFIQLDTLDDGPRRIIVRSPYLQNAWVFSAIQVMALNFAQAEWRIMQGEDEEAVEVLPRKVTDGWVPRLFRYVSPTENRYSLWESVLVWMAIAGESFWQLKRALNNQVAEIGIIPPMQMTEALQNGRLIGWTREYNGVREALPAEDIIQYKYFNPYNPWRGLSPFTAAMLGIHVDFAASLGNYYFFNNDSTPVGHLKSDQELNPEEADAAELRWSQKMRGLSKKGRVPVLGKGLEYIPTAFTNKEIQQIEIKKWSREEVFAVLNVPPALSQVLEFASIKSNIKEQRQQLFENNLIPKMRFIEDVLKTQFFDREKIPHLRGEFDTSGISALKETIAEKVTSAKALFDMSVPFNVINEKLGFGFDPLPWGDQGYLPATYLPAGMEPPEKEPKKDVAIDLEEEPKKSIEVIVRKRKNPLAAANRALESVTKQERIFRDELGEYFRKMRSDVLNNVFTKSIKAMGDEIFDDLLPDFEEYDKAIVALSIPIYQAVIEISIKNMSDALGTQVSMSTARADAVINSKAIQLREINDTIREQLVKDVRPIIRDAVQRGDSYATVAERIADEVKNIFNNAYRRTTTVARTEVNGTLNEARWETMKEVGVEKHQWISTRQIRESHMLNHLEIRTMGDTFPSGIKYPYDPDAPPEEVINCSCVSIPVME